MTSSTLLVKKLVVQGTLCRVKPSMQNRLVKELRVCDHVVCVCARLNPSYTGRGMNMQGDGEDI